MKAGACVHVVMTTCYTVRWPGDFWAISGRQVITGLWDEPEEFEITHVALPDRADASIAPATASIIVKFRSGLADDMLSTMSTATTAPVVFAPAMNNRIWENPIIQANIERLTSLGYKLVEPGVGRLACGVDAVGRLADPDEIISALENAIRPKQDLAGVTILSLPARLRKPSIRSGSLPTVLPARWVLPSPMPPLSVGPR